MIEREDILNDMVTRLHEIPGVRLVTRNFRKAGTLNEFPSVFVVDLGDSVDEFSSRNAVNNKKRMRVGIVSIIQGSTEESAPQEMSAFQGQVQKQIYQYNQTIGTTYKGSIHETNTSALVFPPIGNKVVAQAIEFEIMFVEDIRRLFT